MPDTKGAADAGLRFAIGKPAPNFRDMILAQFRAWMLAAEQRGAAQRDWAARERPNRRCGRVVECAGLLPRYGLPVIVGSNPTASADFAGIEGSPTLPNIPFS